MTWNWTMVAIGCFGGLIPDIMRLIQKRHEAGLPAYVFSLNFRIALFLLVIIGGLAAFAGQAADWKQALAIGYAGPEFFSRALATKPITLARADSTAAVRRWWAF